jgi:hypothetical protein
MRVATLLLALGFPGLLPGQLVRGRVIGGGDSLPIARAVVELRGVETAFSARTTTTASGAFSIASPRPGRYQVRVAAIGYEPRLGEPFEVPSAGVRLDDLALRQAALSLRDLEVLESATRCGSLGAGSELLGRLLDGARTSLEVMEQAMGGSGSSFRIEAVRRTALAGRRDSIVTADTSRGQLARWPIAAIDPDVLRESGFASARHLAAREGRIWYGPDLGVLSADWFLTSHCFRVDPRRSDSTSVTLLFEPRARTDLVDIAGSLVLDPATLTLTAMTFEHRNLPDRLPRGVAGGELRFAALPSGLWLPTSWRIFAPIQGERSRRAMGIEERSGRVVGVESGGASAPVPRSRPTRELEYTVPRAALVPPDSLTDLSHYAAAIDAACPGFAGLERDAMFDRERRLALEAGKGAPALATWLALGCARAQLDADGAFAREGLLMPLGDGWQAGATRAFLKVLELDRTNVVATELLAVMALEQAAPVAGPEVRSALAWAVTSGVTAPAAVRGCALLSLRLGDLAASNQCITVGLEGAGDSTWQLLHLARLASRSIDTATVSLLIDAALGAAHDDAAWREVGWHLRWFTEPAEWDEWLALPDEERAAWVRDRMATRDVKDGRRLGARWVEHFRRLDHVEEYFVVELPRRQRGRMRVAATPENRLDPESVRFLGSALIPARYYRYFKRWDYRIDDRGVVWMRFGEPVQRSTEAICDDSQPPNCNIREGWLHRIDGQPMVLSFEGELFDGNVEATRIVAGVLGRYLCDLDPWRCALSDRAAFNSIAPERMEEVRDTDRANVERATTRDDNSVVVANPVGTVAHLSRAWDPASGSPIAVVSYALGASDVAVGVGTEPPIAELRLTVRQWSRVMETWRTTSIDRRLAMPSTTEDDSWITGFVVIPSDPDVTAWSLVVEQDSTRRGRAWRDDMLPVPEGPLEISDLILGATSQGQTWTTTGGTAVVLGPLGAFDRHEPLALYWQVRSRVARAQATIGVALYRVSARGERAELTVEFATRLGAGLTELQREVGIERLDGGEYRLEVTVRDPASGAAASRSVRLLVK